MPKHAFKFPRAVVEAVCSHVEDAIRRVPPERFRQEATYTAALANQLQGGTYSGEHGSVVFESTVVNDPARIRRKAGTALIWRSLPQ